MVSPDLPTKLSSYRSIRLRLAGVVNYEGFFVTQKVRRQVILQAPNY